MNLLNLAMSVLGGKGGAQAAILGAAAELLTKQGGMGALLKQFEGAGLGELMKGWISTGPNPAIKPEQLASALGPETIAGLAQKAGLDQNALLAGLAAQLPSLIDQLTPDGNAVEGDALQQGLGALLGKLGK